MGEYLLLESLIIVIILPFGRYGSWNNAVRKFGYEITDTNRKYELEDGEICASSYEYIISKWFKNNNIKYDRNIKYVNIDIFGYNGKMDCDYLLHINDNDIYVEMAGFMPKKDLVWEKFSNEEKNYTRKLRYKIKLLKRSKVKYYIVYPNDILNKSMDDIYKDILSFNNIKL